MRNNLKGETSHEKVIWFKVVLQLVVLSTVGCSGGVPGKSDVQGAMERYAASDKSLFGDDKQIVKDTKCTNTGNDTFECITSLATSSDPEPRTITIQLTKLSGEWKAQITKMD